MTYRIIKNNKITNQYKILDYFSKTKEETIDCRTIEGKRRYKGIFGKTSCNNNTNISHSKIDNKLLINDVLFNIEQIQSLMGMLNERDRRLYAGTLSSSIGVGGDRIISEITGLDVKTIRKGRKELINKDQIPKDNIRRLGSGRHSKEDSEKNYEKILLVLIEDDIEGNPMNEKKYTRKTLRWIKANLKEENIDAAISTIRKTLNNLKITLKQNKKSIAIKNHPQRAEQFDYLNKLKKEFLATGKPIISIDTKKKEMIGNFLNPGKTWCREPYETFDHDFRNLAEGILIPFGIYDLVLNKGYLYCGNTYETSEFIVDALILWWTDYGKKQYPDQKELLILCDSGGANGYRRRGWKWELQNRFTDKFGITVTICHYPSYCSKWNPIEHKLFSFISLNWLGIPLRSYKLAINYISSTKTIKGLSVVAQLIDKFYQRGIKITDSMMGSLNLKKADICPQWNYTINPRGFQQ